MRNNKRMPMNTVYLTTAYLAPVEYYAKMLAADCVCMEQYDHYQKQTYRNRCTIAGPNGELALTIPVVKPEGKHCFMNRNLRSWKLASSALECH